MLKKQRRIRFVGGLEASRITDKIADDLRSLRIECLFLACDHKNSLEPFKKSMKILKKAGFKRDHIQCYVLIGKDIKEEEERLREVFNSGALPFAQLYRNRNDDIIYSKEYKQFARTWSRPAVYKNMIKREERQ